MTETFFDFGRLALLGLIALIILALLSIFAINAVEGLFTSYQDERLETINAQADADAAAARQAEAAARLAEAQGVREVLEASAYAVRVDATTVGFWTVVGPIATATLLGMIVISAAVCILVKFGAPERLGAWIGAREIARGASDG